MPILESIEKKLPQSEVGCDYCSREIVGEPVVYKYRNKVYFFCCETYLGGSIEKSKLSRR